MRGDDRVGAEVVEHLAVGHHPRALDEAGDAAVGQQRQHLRAGQQRDRFHEQVEADLCESVGASGHDRVAGEEQAFAARAREDARAVGAGVVGGEDQLFGDDAVEIVVAVAAADGEVAIGVGGHAADVADVGGPAGVGEVGDAVAGEREEAAERQRGDRAVLDGQKLRAPSVDARELDDDVAVGGTPRPGGRRPGAGGQ